MLVIQHLVASPPPPPLPPEDLRPAAVSRLMETRPLAAHNEEMVHAADYYGIDWRLLPTIAILESGGGRQTCAGNAWGWNSCLSDFSYFPDFSFGIWFVAHKLSQPPYKPDDPDFSLCMWVSGHGCYGDHALNYLGNAHSLMGVYLQ